MADTMNETESRFGLKERKYNSTLLIMIEDLFEDGLETQIDPFPEDDRAFAKTLMICARWIKTIWKVCWISAVGNSPHGKDQMRCQECMYYLVNKRWCDLPELDLPAEPDWWCRLWRI